jgi:hypothetical protein
MTGRSFSGLFIAEGSSDFPLSDIVELLFASSLAILVELSN